MKKIILIFLACILMIIQAQSQSQSFVQLRGKQFFYKGETFFPMVANYVLYEIMDNPSIPIYPRGDEVNPGNFQTQIKADMIRIKNAEFNTIRLLGFEARVDPATQKLVFGYDASGNHVRIEPPYKEHFDRIDLALSLIESSNQDIKIIFFVGGGFTDEYTSYIQALVSHLKDKKEIMAYDICGEPDLVYDNPILTKKYVCNLVADWYYKVKSITKNQLVTIGLWTGNGYWDFNMLCVDFISIHPYPGNIEYSNIASYLKYMGTVCKKPWIIGETGRSGNDNYIGVVPPPYDATYLNTIASEAQQRDYAEFSVKRAIDCGASGYSWWVFRDRTNMDELDCNGLVYDMDSGDSDKPSYNFFKSFNVKTYTINPNNCFNIPDVTYFNPLGFNGFKVSGQITDIYGNPVKNAVVEGTFNGGGNYTFTDVNGYYNIYSNDISNKIIQIKAYYPGMSYEKSEVNTLGVISPVNLILKNVLSPDNVLVSGNIGNGQSLPKSSSNLITVNNLTVTGNGNVTLIASNIIKFNTGFSAQKGSSVYAYVGPFQDCDNVPDLKSAVEPNEDISQTKINTIDISSGHFIFPNPSDGKFNYVFKDNSSINTRLEIFNINGQKVYSSVLSNGFNLINISDRPKGIYILKAFIKDKVYIDKLVKN